MGPLLFLIYINDIGDNITSSLRLFADDCLFYKRTDTENDAINLQKDLDTIIKWSERWQNDFQPHQMLSVKNHQEKKPTMTPVDNDRCSTCRS